MFSQNYLRSLHKNAKWRKIICANSKIAQSSLGQQTKLRKKQHFAQKLNPFNCVKTKLYQKKFIFMNLQLLKISWLFSIPRLLSIKTIHNLLEKSQN